MTTKEISNFIETVDQGEFPSLAANFKTWEKLKARRCSSCARKSVPHFVRVFNAKIADLSREEAEAFRRYQNSLI